VFKHAEVDRTPDTRTAASPSARLLALALALVWLPACESPRVGQAIGVGSSSWAHVEDVALRGEFVDATLRGDSFALRFFFPTDQNCREILTPEARVEYVTLGPLGSVRADSLRCDPVGVGSLGDWLRRRRRHSRLANPRQRVDYRVVYRDPEVVFLRGRFPLSRQVGWSGGFDALAVVPNVEACAAFLERTVATMDYRVNHDVPFTLVGEPRCPVIGFILPLGRQGEPS
jgi:hypothetical protein